MSKLLRLLRATGDLDILEAVEAAQKCVKQMESEAWKQDPQQMQAVLKTFRYASAYVTQAAIKDVPEGPALLEELGLCERVLMIPDTPIEDHEDPYLRPEHEVDLSAAYATDHGPAGAMDMCIAEGSQHHLEQIDDSERASLLPKPF